MALTDYVTIATLEDLHQAFSDFLQEDAPPPVGDILYQRRTRFFNMVREDLANRWFFKSLLKPGTISVVANSPTYQLPLDLTRPNALYFFSNSAGTVVYTDPFDKSGVVISITRNFTTGGYQVTFTPTPASNDTAPLSYFAHPGKLVNDADLVLVDGQAVLFGALQHHWFVEGDFDRMPEARQELENRIEELIKMGEINPPGALTGMKGFERANHLTNEKGFYAGNTRRSR